MEGWPKLQLVATPDVGAAVLYDFNSPLASVATAAEGFDSGAPGWSGQLGQPGGGDDYRTIRLTHRVMADDAAAVTLLQGLGSC